MTRPTDAAVARAFWKALSDEMDPYDAPDFSRFLRKVKILAERFDAEAGGTDRQTEEVMKVAARECKAEFVPVASAAEPQAAAPYDPAHPIQPLVMTESGVVRFKANAIVRYLLDNGGINMNDLAVEDFTREDREQFAQLIGYSHSGSGDLSYMSDAVWYAAHGEYEARTEQVTTSPERVQIPAESEHVAPYDRCPKCTAHMPVGKVCGGVDCGLRGK